MPEKQTLERVKRDRRQGKSTSTQAGEFIREEMHHIRRGKHGARSSKQAIAIGLSKARRAGVRLAPPAPGSASAKTRRRARRDVQAGRHPKRRVSAKRSRGTMRALKRERRGAASRHALSRQTHRAARNRTHAERVAAARKAARTRKRRAG